MMRIAVLVSGGGSNLQALIDSEKRGKLRSGRICLVIADREGAYALERAKHAGIKALLINKKALGKEPFEAALQEALLEADIDCVILAGFLSILGQTILDAYQNRIINVHPSLIPAFCGDGFYGLKVHEAALKRGVKLSGATVHYVNHITDGGEILLQKALPVKKDDTPESLQQRIMEKAEWQILPRAAEMLCRRLCKERNDAKRKTK